MNAKNTCHKNYIFKVPLYGSTSTFTIKFNSLSTCLNPIDVRHLPILTSIWIHAWNIAKANIIVTRVGKKFGVMKPRMWWWTAWHNALETWEIVKDADSYLLHQWRFRSVVWIITFQNLCFHFLRQSAWPRYKIQQCQCFIAPPAHTSCRQPSHVGLSYHCLMQPSGNQYLHKSRSLSSVAM